MERLSNVEKMEKARKLADRGRYEEALGLIRELDRNKIRALPDLSAVADIYEANGLYEEAYQILEQIYAKSKTRRILYQLTVLSVKLKDVEAAGRYFAEFEEIAPSDPDRYVLRFLIDKLQKKPLEVQIESLEALKEYEYVEEWAFELAKLYHKAGMDERCIRECRDIELWFGDGPVVDKAAALRESLQPEEETGQLELHFEESIAAQIAEIEREETSGTEHDPEPVDEEVEDATPEPEEIEEAMPVDEEAEDAAPEPEEIEEAMPEITDEVEDATPEPDEIEEAILETEEPADEPEKPLELPEDSLVRKAVSWLEEDDYILTQEQIGWIGEWSEELRVITDQAEREEEMRRRILAVIDRAERRNMARLLDIVNKSSYRESGLLSLEPEDFHI